MQRNVWKIFSLMATVAGIVVAMVIAARTGDLKASIEGGLMTAGGIIIGTTAIFRMAFEKW